jgi:hypothetical protein
MLKKNQILLFGLLALLVIIILVVVILSNNKSKEKFENSNDDNSILSEECNNNGYFNPITKECECKKQQMLLKTDNQYFDFAYHDIREWKHNQLQTNYTYENVQLYSGEKCELPVQLTSLNFTPTPCEPNKTCAFTSNSANDLAYKHDERHVLYSKDVPMDVEDFSSILLLKICPFHAGLKIKNLKINKGSIPGLGIADGMYPLGENTGYQDVNDCKIIYQGYSGFPVKSIMSLTGLPVISDSWTHLGGIDCDFTLVGKYNTEEEWSIDLNVKRQGFDLINSLLENPGVSYNLDMKVSYKDTGAEYDNYYVKNGTFDIPGLVPYGMGVYFGFGIPFDPPFPSMIMIGEPTGVYLNPFKKAAKDAGYETSDDSQIFMYLINNYVVKCDGNIYPWLSTQGFWESIFFSNPMSRLLAENTTFIIPWLSTKDNANPCVITNTEIFNIRNILLASNPYNSIYIYFNGSWITDTRGTDLSFIPASILDWITKIKGILIINDDPGRVATGAYVDAIPYKLSFDIGTPESDSITKANTLPSTIAHDIAVSHGNGTCKYVYVIPWDGVKFLNYNITHGTNSSIWQWGGVWIDSPFTSYQGMKIDPDYVFESVNFTGLDVTIVVSQETDDGSPYIYEINIKKGDCGYFIGSSTIEVYGTDNIQIEQPIVGYLGTDTNGYPGVVVVGKKTNKQSTIEMDFNVNIFPPRNPRLNISSKDYRYDYFIKQPMVSPDYSITNGNYPGFVFITPKVSMQMLCTTDKGCNTNGKCTNYSCVCNDGYYGNNCEYKKCLNNCSGKGRCKDGICICDKSQYYSGDDCSKIDCSKFVDVIRECKKSSCKDLDKILSDCKSNSCDPRICSAATATGCYDQNDCRDNQFCFSNSDGSGTSGCICKYNWKLTTSKSTNPLNCAFYNYDIANNLYGLTFSNPPSPIGPPPAVYATIILSLNNKDFTPTKCFDASGNPSDFVNMVGGVGAVLKYVEFGKYSNATCTLSLDGTVVC